MIKSPIAQHRIQHIAASAGQSDKRLIVPLALADLAVAVSPGDGIAQRREGRQEHGPFQDPVASPGGMLATDGATRTAGDRRQARVGGQMGGRGEGSEW